ncbi:12237_t:CDS:1, partial [Entrophospora sp. SA101]
KTPKIFFFELGLDIGDDTEAVEAEETINPIDEASVETSMEEVD